MAGSALAIDDSNFEAEVLKSDVPVFVDFWAEWCGPCLRVAPFVEELADDYQGRAKVAKVNVDQAQQTAAKYGVMSIPTFIVFKGGEPVELFTGGIPKEEMAKLIDKHL